MSETTRRISDVADDTLDRVQDYSDQARTAAARARDRLADAAEKGGEWASERSREAAGSSRALLSAACDAISARPVMAVGIALVAGFLIARMASRH